MTSERQRYPVLQLETTTHYKVAEVARCHPHHWGQDSQDAQRGRLSLALVARALESAHPSPLHVRTVWLFSVERRGWGHSSPSGGWRGFVSHRRWWRGTFRSLRARLEDAENFRAPSSSLSPRGFHGCDSSWPQELQELQAAWWTQFPSEEQSLVVRLYLCA